MTMDPATSEPCWGRISGSLLPPTPLVINLKTNNCTETDVYVLVYYEGMSLDHGGEKTASGGVGVVEGDALCSTHGGPPRVPLSVKS